MARYPFPEILQLKDKERKKKKKKKDFNNVETIIMLCTCCIDFVV